MTFIIYRAVRTVFSVLEVAILIRVFISWLPVPKNNRLIELLYMVTEPVLAPIRNMIQKSSFGKNMMFDISPIVAIILIGILRNIILSLLR